MILLRFLVFLPIGVLLVAGYLLVDLLIISVLMGEWHDTIYRWFRSGWQWVIGEASAFEPIQ